MQFINLAFHEFVDNWYPTISSEPELKATMRALLEDIIRTIEQRIFEVNLLDAVYGDVLFVFKRHVEAYRLSKELVGSAYAGALNIDEVFDRIQPLFALRDADREPEREEVYSSRPAIHY